jgi:hypothetical protein
VVVVMLINIIVLVTFASDEVAPHV